MKQTFKTIFFGFILTAISSNLASAACSGQFNPGEFCGNDGVTLGQPGPILLTPGVLQPIGSGTILSNITGATAPPAANSISSVFDFIGSTRGSLLYRGVTGWSILTPGTSGQILTANGAGADPSWGNVIGTVSSVGLSLPSFITVTGSPVTSSGTLTGTLATQTANTIFSGPGTGAAAQPTFRALVGADLPNPSSTTLGGVRSLAAVTSRWINQISTAGVPSATQPNFTDIAGSATLAQLPVISNNSILGNNSGGSAIPQTISASNVLDMIGTTQGMVLYRGMTSWSVLSPGTSGQVLTTNGAAANPSWATVSGTGTVTTLTAGSGIAFSSGATCTTTCTISLASIAAGTVLANATGGATTPTATTPTAILDIIGSTTGDILYRAGGGWQVLAAGTNGQVLTMGASTPAWGSAGTVSSVATNGGLTGGTITTTGTLQLDGNYTGFALSNCTITASVSGNNLTVALKDNTGADPSTASPCNVNFRNATSATGSTILRQVTAATSFVANAGSTLGALSTSTPFRIWILAFDTGSGVQIGVYNPTVRFVGGTGVQGLDDENIQTSQACNACATATSASVFYTTSVLSNRPIRILGYLTWESGLATAGNWASAPSVIQTAGPGTLKPGETVKIFSVSTSTPITTSAGPVPTDLSIQFAKTSAANSVKFNSGGQILSNASNASALVRMYRGGGIGTCTSSTVAVDATAVQPLNGIQSVTTSLLDLPAASDTNVSSYTLCLTSTSGTSVSFPYSSAGATATFEEIMN